MQKKKTPVSEQIKLKSSSPMSIPTPKNPHYIKPKLNAEENNSAEKKPGLIKKAEKSTSVSPVNNSFAMSFRDTFATLTQEEDVNEEAKEEDVNEEAKEEEEELLLNNGENFVDYQSQFSLATTSASTSVYTAKTKKTVQFSVSYESDDERVKKTNLEKKDSSIEEDKDIAISRKLRILREDINYFLRWHEDKKQFEYTSKKPKKVTKIIETFENLRDLIHNDDNAEAFKMLKDHNIGLKKLKNTVSKLLQTIRNCIGIDIIEISTEQFEIVRRSNTEEEKYKILERITFGVAEEFFGCEKSTEYAVKVIDDIYDLYKLLNELYQNAKNNIHGINTEEDDLDEGEFNLYKNQEKLTPKLIINKNTGYTPMLATRLNKNSGQESSTEMQTERSCWLFSCCFNPS